MHDQTAPWGMHQRVLASETQSTVGRESWLNLGDTYADGYADAKYARTCSCPEEDRTVGIDERIPRCTVSHEIQTDLESLPPVTFVLPLILRSRKNSSKQHTSLPPAG